jgi:hypothetical protein
MKTLQAIIIILLLVSCKKETPTVNETIDKIKETTEVVANEGKGKITLNCNGKTFTVDGVCGALVSMDHLTIAIKDSINPAKVFTISFNTADFPLDGKEYLIKSKDYTLDKNPDNEVSVGFMEALPNNKMNVWETQPTSGKLIFSVKGNEIKCQLKDIKLEPSIVYNADDLQGEGAVSGEFTLYKN